MTFKLDVPLSTYLPIYFPSSLIDQLILYYDPEREKLTQDFCMRLLGSESLEMTNKYRVFYELKYEYLPIFYFQNLLDMIEIESQQFARSWQEDIDNQVNIFLIWCKQILSITTLFKFYRLLNNEEEKELLTLIIARWFKESKRSADICQKMIDHPLVKRICQYWPEK